MTEPMRTVTVDMAFPIAQLLPGHKHPLYPANPRKGGHQTSMPELQQSIHDQGVLQPLRIFTDMHADDGKYWVHVGERRLLASELNLAAHPNAGTTVPVMIVSGITPQEAFQESLTEQLNRLPLHVIDQYEAFAELLKGGMDEAAIASHYGIDKRVVKQRIALGTRSPKILAAWRSGVIDEKCAQEFTRLSSHKDQDKLFERQRKSHGLSAHAIRAVLVPDQGDGARLVSFVGLDAYRARGGEIREDLFNDMHGISDAALAGAMAREKLDAECLRLTSMEGWAWAKPADDMPASWRMYERRQPKAELTPAEKKRMGELQKVMDDSDPYEEKFDVAQDEFDGIAEAAAFRSFTDRQKKESGCVLSIDDEGRLSIEAGIILPEGKSGKAASVAIGDGLEDAEPDRTGKQAAPKPEAKAAPTISNSQASELAVTLTEATALSLAGNFNLAMSAALAAFASSIHCPVHLSHNGLGSHALKLTGTDDFAKNLAAFIKMKPQQREDLFARVVAASLRFNAPTAEKHAMTHDDVAALVNAVDPKVMEAQIHKRFDPVDFFERAPKGVTLAAIIDVFGKTDFADTAPKAEVVAYASENVPPSKWLPPHLRAAGYAGPGGKNAAGPTRGKAAKKKAKGAGKARA